MGCATTAPKPVFHPAASAWGRGRAATAHVLAAPSELAHGPLLDQAVVAPMVPGIAVIRQRGRRDDNRRRGRRRGRHGIQEIDDDSNKDERHHTVEVARFDVCGHSYHLELPGGSRRPSCPPTSPSWWSG